MSKPELAPQPSDKPSSLALDSIVWRQPDGALVSCKEKLKILTENIEEIKQYASDALEDAVLMGCDERQVRAVLEDLIRTLPSPYK